MFEVRAMRHNFALPLTCCNILQGAGCCTSPQVMVRQSINKSTGFDAKFPMLTVTLSFCLTHGLFRRGFKHGRLRALPCHVAGSSPTAQP